MTEQEKERHIQQVRAGLAFGGGTMSPYAEKLLRDVLDGKLTYADVRKNLLAECGHK